MKVTGITVELVLSVYCVLLVRCYNPEIRTPKLREQLILRR
jgi:hypothetical protein